MATVTSPFTPPLQRLKPQRHILVPIHFEQEGKTHMVRETVAPSSTDNIGNALATQWLHGALKEKARLPSPEAATLYVPFSTPSLSYLPTCIAHFPVFPFLVLAQFKGPPCGSGWLPCGRCTPSFGDRGPPGTSLDPRSHRLPRAEIATTTALHREVGVNSNLFCILLDIQMTAKRPKCVSPEICEKGP